MKNDVENEVQMPINKISYSAFTQLLRNPIIFKMKHILNIYDTPSGMAAMIGKAVHRALEYRYMDMEQPIDEVIKVGMDFLVETSDAYIDYKKTGSREQMLSDYTQAMQFYFAEEPDYHKIICVEKKWEAECKTIHGDILPLPMTGKGDLVHQFTDNVEDIEIIDHKVVANFTKYENEDGTPHEDYVKVIQAMFMYHLCLAVEGLKAKRIVFREIKKTKNKDGSSQIRDYVIPYDHEAYFIIFYNLFKDVVKYLKNDPVFLPNLSDLFDGEQAGLIYSQGLINADMSDVEVMHKMRDVAFTTKKFIASRLDSVENKNLLPEEKIKVCLAEFGIPVIPVEPQVSVNVTIYKFKVARGVRMSTVEKHKADISRAIEAKNGVRILAPIPGTDLVGVEVANETRTSIAMQDGYLVMGTLSLPIGIGLDGAVEYMKLDEAPHLLIAGATGSGKSMLLHSILTTLTKQMKPENMELVLIDPKRVELVAFDDVPHLAGREIIYDHAKALIELRNLSEEMETRYKLLKKAKCRNIGEYNKKAKNKLPYIVVVIDEFADLMFQGRNAKGKTQSTGPDAEALISRLAAMARAVGIHLIIATQRPSIDVITGLIKSNFPTRIALTTSSSTDSQVIIGEAGAENLNGKGDMLLSTPARHGLVRLQGFMI